MGRSSYFATLLAAVGLTAVVTANATEPQRPPDNDPRRAPRCAEWSAPAVFESEDRAATRATLVNRAGRTAWVRIGERLDEYIVAGISFDSRRIEPRVWLWNGEALCQVNRYAPTSPSAAERTVTTSPRPAKGWNVRIDRAALDEALGRLPELTRGVRIDRQRDAAGLPVARITGIRRGSLLDRLGLEDGDRIIEVDGRRITTPAVVLELYASLRSRSEFRIGIERDGKPVRLSLHID